MPSALTQPVLARAATIVHAGPDEVWAALATADGLGSWFTGGTRCDLDARVGGVLRLRWTDWGPDRWTGERAAQVTAYEPHHAFGFAWDANGDGAVTTVRFTLAKAHGGTIVRVTEEGFAGPDGVQAALDDAAGWGEALTLLKFYVEHGVTY